MKLLCKEQMERYSGHDLVSALFKGFSSTLGKCHGMTTAMLAGRNIVFQQVTV